MNQEDQGDHNSPWWTRSSFYILLMHPMDVSAGELADQLECITEVSGVSSTEEPIHLDIVLRRTGYPYPPGSLSGISARIKMSESGGQQGSPKPRYDSAFLDALVARASLAMRDLHGKIVINQVKIADLDERVQGLVHEIQDT